jgi:hypothetical protein
MIRKRRSLSSGRPLGEAVPVSRARVSQPPIRKRAATRVEENALTKQQLIQLYAERRREQGMKPVGRGSLVVVVALVVLIAMGGWWLTFRGSLQEDSQSSASLFQGLRERTQDLGQQISAPPSLEAVKPLVASPEMASGTQGLLRLPNSTGTNMGLATSTHTGATTTISR